MNLRERNVWVEQPRQTPTAGIPDSNPLAAQRKAGEQFLTAGDDAIEQALSDDAQQFLESSLQTGGQ